MPLLPLSSRACSLWQAHSLLPISSTSATLILSGRMKALHNISETSLCGLFASGFCGTHVTSFSWCSGESVFLETGIGDPGRKPHDLSESILSKQPLFYFFISISGWSDSSVLSCIVCFCFLSIVIFSPLQDGITQDAFHPVGPITHLEWHF